MAAFATDDELRNFVGDQSIDSAQAQLILDAVSDEIRDALGWSVTEETGVTVTLDGPGDEKLLLPTMHLTAVTSVTENGTSLTADDYLIYQAGYLRRVVSGFPIDWTTKLQGVTAVFDHGYPDGSVPGVFKAVTLETAGRIAENPGGALKSKTVGRVAVTYADVRAAAAGAGDDSRLDYYRLPEGF